MDEVNFEYDQYSGEIKRRAKSQFIITCNPNVSRLQFERLDKRDRLELIIQLKQFNEKLVKNIQTFSKDKSTPVDVLEHSINFEVGPTTKKLHTHMFIKLSRFCPLDLPIIKQLARDTITLSNGCMVNVRYVHDGSSVAKHYVEKDTRKRQS